MSRPYTYAHMNDAVTWYDAWFGPDYDARVATWTLYHEHTQVGRHVVETVWARRGRHGTEAAQANTLIIEMRGPPGPGPLPATVWRCTYRGDLSPGGLAEAHAAVVARVRRGDLPREETLDFG